ncbi:hypothetical protein [Microbacterium sp. GXF0217]
MKLDDADLLLQKIATIAIMYYRELPADSPEYQLNDDIDWCLDGIELDPQDAELRDLIGRTIVDPTSHREALTEYVYALVPGAAEADG